MGKKEVAKRDDTIRVEAHLSPEDFKEFEKVMHEKDWSKKKLAENIIKEYLIAYKKKKK